MASYSFSSARQAKREALAVLDGDLSNQLAALVEAGI